MTHFMKTLALASLLFCGIAPARAADTLEATWLRLIQADFGPSCAVERLKVGSVVSGNNGLRSEQWFLQTCQGTVEYTVAYYPPSAFPGRASPYEVMRVAPVTGARPNNSFKPKPLRGSA
ncbi:hypothetical protein GCM10027430_27060 [Lysobacter tyrosinilyticus]